MKKRLTLILVFGIILLFALPGCQELKWKDHFKRANQYFMQKKFKKAAIEYEKALKYNPELLPAHFFLATSYQSLYRQALDNEAFRQRAEKSVIALAVKKGLDPEFAKFLAKLDTEDKLRAAYYLLKEEWYVTPAEKKLDISTDSTYKTDIYIIGKKLSPAELVNYYDQKFQEMLPQLKKEFEEYRKKMEEEAKKKAEEEAKKARKARRKKVSVKKTKKSKEEKKTEETKKEETPQEVKREDVGFAIKYIENRLRILGAIKHYTYYMNHVQDEKEKKKAIQALAELYDRIGDFANAEKYYLEFFGENPTNPQYYYILAEFYNKYGKYDKAEEYYKKRIELDPTDPEGYLYLANFYSNQVGKLPKESRKEIFVKAIELMDKAIKAHEKRLELIPEPRIVDGKKIAEVSLEKLPEGIQFPEEISDKIEYDAQNKVLRFKGTMTDSERDQLLKLSDDPAWQKAVKLLYLSSNKEKAYYYLGFACWSKSYRISRVMTLKDRVSTLKKGLKALNRALELNPDYAEAHVYKNLIYREFAKAYPAKKKYYLKLAKKEMEMYKKIMERKAAKKKALESLGS